jgi:hypothetical protein
MIENKEFAETYLGHNGKILSWSKSSYKEENPANLVVFNSNVFTKKSKIWYGDLDISLSKETLLMLANSIDEDIYILREMDGRFENENSPALEKFVAKFTPGGEAIKGPLYESFVL